MTTKTDEQQNKTEANDGLEIKELSLSFIMRKYNITHKKAKEICDARRRIKSKPVRVWNF